MTNPSRGNDQDASRQVLEALRTAPEPLRSAAREAIEDGNQETFVSLVTEFLQTPTSGYSQPRIAPQVLNRVDWDWLAGEFLAGPYPSHIEPPPPGPRPGNR
jgi:hypothetical protein